MARPARRHTGIWIVIAALFAAALIGTLWVPFYNHLTPVLGGFPLFYWQSLMASAIIVAIPVALLYNVFLGRFIQGFTLGAVKG